MNRINYLNIVGYGVLTLDAISFISEIDVIHENKDHTFQVMCAGGVHLPFIGTKKEVELLRAAILYVLQHRETTLTESWFGEFRISYDIKREIATLETTKE